MPYNPPAFTADELLDAIRRAADLNELKRMIGPTVE